MNNSDLSKLFRVVSYSDNFFISKFSPICGSVQLVKIITLDSFIIAFAGNIALYSKSYERKFVIYAISSSDVTKILKLLTRYSFIFAYF